MADAHTLRREWVVRDLRPPGRRGPDERALPHVRIPRDDDRRDVGVHDGQAPERGSRGDEALEVSRDLADDGRETPERLPAEAEGVSPPPPPRPAPGRGR